jgi:hypothetical protein
MPGIVLVTYAAGMAAVKSMMKDTTRKVKKTDSMVMSKILFLFQSAYVLRMKKHSEQMTDTTPRPESILPNTRHLLGLLFEVKSKYRFAVTMIKGRYRVITYRLFTLLHCDRSKNVHCALFMK